MEKTATTQSGKPLNMGHIFAAEKQVRLLCKLKGRPDKAIDDIFGRLHLDSQRVTKPRVWAAHIEDAKLIATELKSIYKNVTCAAMRTVMLNERERIESMRINDRREYLRKVERPLTNNAYALKKLQKYADAFGNPNRLVARSWRRANLWNSQRFYHDYFSKLVKKKFNYDPSAYGIIYGKDGKLYSWSAKTKIWVENGKIHVVKLEKDETYTKWIERELT